MWFDKENRVKKELLILSKDKLTEIKDKLLQSCSKLQMGDIYLNTKVAEAQIELINEILDLSKTEMKEIEDYTYISLNSDVSSPYLEGLIITKEKDYNSNYNENEECECGHSYHRHFDSYEKMASVGCKYCQCYHFTPKKLV